MLNYLTNLQGTTYLYAFASKVENNIHPDQLASGPGKCLGILSSAVFSKLIYYIDYHIDHHQSQTVWIQIRSDILSVLIWLKLFAKVISRQQLQAKSNFSSVYLTNLQGTVSAMFTARTKILDGIHQESKRFPSEKVTDLRKSWRNTPGHVLFSKSRRTLCL